MHGKKVVILHDAKLDLLELKQYIVINFSQAIWKKTYKQLNDVMNGLKEQPLKGYILPELDILNLRQYRQIICGMNRLIYEIEKNRIYIHAILDSRRDAVSLLHKRLLRTNL